MAELGYRTKLSYVSSPTLWEFILCDNFVTGILGPLGSGKSVGACAKIMKKAMEQEPDPRDNIRKTRWLVIRNTYVELRATTIKTWLDVFPEANCGPIVYSHPITHNIKRPAVGNEPGLHCEVIFLALDKPQDVKKLKSLDLTGAWINEACEVPLEILNMLTGRVGRFPGDLSGTVKATWCGIILDTNASDDQNWYYKAAENDETPALDLDPEIFGGYKTDLSWRFFKQPPAVLEVKDTGREFRIAEAGFEKIQVPENRVIEAGGRLWTFNPAAENFDNLRPGYYVQQISRKQVEWIQRFLQAKYVYFVEGKPWVPEYSDAVMARDIKWNKGLPLIGGIDCGGGTLSPAAVVGQRGTYGDWRTLKEFSVFDTGIERFSVGLHTMLSREFPGLQVSPQPMNNPPVVGEPRFYLDPAAHTRDEVYETAVEDHLRSRGFNVQLAPTNKPVIIREAYAAACTRSFNLSGNLIPGFIVDRSCTMLRAGLGGKWYRRQMVTTAERYTEAPEKNDWSHVCDAAGTMLVGGGELHGLKHAMTPMEQANRVVGQMNRASLGGVFQAPTDFNPLD